MPPEARPRRPLLVLPMLAAAALIALLVALLWPAAPAVPEPGPDAVEGLSEMLPCDFEGEDGSVPAECGTLLVPETRSDPDSELIALPVVRILSTSDDPGTPIFRLGGGPGRTNLDFPEATRFIEDRDVVLVGYRGVDGSRRLDCPEVVEAQQSSPDMASVEGLAASTDAYEACADRLTDEGVDLTSYSIAQRVDDIEAAREALGYERLDLLSTSAGTRAAMIYSWRHPESIERSAMISVNTPGHFVWDPEITDDQFAQYADLCSADAACADRTDDLDGTVQAEAADMPDRWGPLRIEDGAVRALSMFGMHYSLTGAPMSAPSVLDAYLAGSEGDASGYWAMSVLAEMFLPASTVHGEFASYAMIDAPAAQALQADGGDPGSVLGGAGTDVLWGGDDGIASVWPDSQDDEAYHEVLTSETETLLVSGSVDFSTPAELATDDLLPALPNGHQVILPDLGHTTDFWANDPEGGQTLLNTFFATGEVLDDAVEDHPVDFDAPSPTFSQIAAILVGVTAGTALLALWILVASALRIRRHGGFTAGGRRHVRLLLALPVGIGSWSLGALVAWSALPSVVVTGVPNITITVGIGVGLLVGMVTRRVGAAGRVSLALGAGIAGALLGALLGSLALPGIAGILTAILGATAGAVLATAVVDRVAVSGRGLAPSLRDARVSRRARA